MPRYIDAEKLIARLRKIADEKWNKRAAPMCWSDAYEHFIDELEEAETEDVAPAVHAHWTKLWFDDEDRLFGVEPSNYKCSACGGIVLSKALRAGLYCLECGARMGEEDG